MEKVAKSNKNWETKRVKISEIHSFKDNPRTITEEDFNDVKESLAEDGDWGILVVDTDGTILAGNQRYRALLEQGVKEVDVKIAPKKLTQKERRRIILRSNRTKGKDNFDILANWDESDLLSGWLSEEEIMMRIGLNEAESQYVDEDRFNVLMVMPPNSPQLKERINLNCKSLEEYLKVKEYVSKNGVEEIMEKILEMVLSYLVYLLVLVDY